MDTTTLLTAYDEQLRTSGASPDAAITTLGPVKLVEFTADRGFVTYRDLADADEGLIGQLVAAARAFFEADTAIREVEWKTRGHDHAPGLHEALTAHGFVPEEPESIMLGEAKLLATDVPLPEGVTLRQVEDENDVRAMSAMADEVFGGPISEERANALLQRLQSGDGTELWVAEADGKIVSSGRLQPVPRSDFAGIWGGSTRPEWRGRGIYRALTAARARSALRMGKTLIHSDSTEYSRPILERSGLIKVSTTTPYVWRRPVTTDTHTERAL
ncbi:GNAT family N-acetyltransferase [Microbacterium sp.]|uniref:GNAT family N-acetyltransferase n=1 Tax=Microbacterium sp. TaxID=51671 RepID=UPI0028120C0B|nr:GNAT family N-acetyltransferase [Microbacterium sp.]